MGCGCGGKKPTRSRSRVIKPLSAPRIQSTSVSDTLSSDGTLDKQRREIERKRRETILKKLGRL